MKHLEVTPGGKVAVALLPDGRAELHAVKPEDAIEKFFGCLQRPGTKPLTIDEIKELAAEGWAGIR